jgi:hypothetical protein
LKINAKNIGLKKNVLLHCNKQYNKVKVSKNYTVMSNVVGIRLKSGMHITNSEARSLKRMTGSALSA